jgi:hypothetical protein
MSRTYHHGERRIRVKAVRRNPPDLKKLARAFVGLAQAQAEAEAQSQDSDQDQRPDRAGRHQSTPPPNAGQDVKPDTGGAP